MLDMDKIIKEAVPCKIYNLVRRNVTSISLPSAWPLNFGEEVFMFKSNMFDGFLLDKIEEPPEISFVCIGRLRLHHTGLKGRIIIIPKYFVKTLERKKYMVLRHKQYDGLIYRPIED